MVWVFRGGTHLQPFHHSLALFRPTVRHNLHASGQVPNVSTVPPGDARSSGPCPPVTCTRASSASRLAPAVVIDSQSGAAAERMSSLTGWAARLMNSFIRCRPAPWARSVDFPVHLQHKFQYGFIIFHVLEGTVLCEGYAVCKTKTKTVRRCSTHPAWSEYTAFG